MTDYTLTSVAAGPARERFLPLLLLADESGQHVRSYMQRGDLFGFMDADGTAVGIVLTIPAADGSVELKAVAVDPARQNLGIGQLASYQKAGFRLLRIERDFFSPARGYPAVMEDNGIRLRDMVWMDQELG